MLYQSLWFSPPLILLINVFLHTGHAWHIVFTSLSVENDGKVDSQWSLICYICCSCHPVGDR